MKHSDVHNQRIHCKTAMHKDASALYEEQRELREASAAEIKAESILAESSTAAQEASNAIPVATDRDAALILLKERMDAQKLHRCHPSECLVAQ